MKIKKTLVILFALVVITLSFVIYKLFIEEASTPKEDFNQKMQEINNQDWQQTGEFNEEEDNGITFELSLIDSCDSGEWVDAGREVSVREMKEFSGVVTSADETEQNKYMFENGYNLIFPRVEFGEFLDDRSVIVKAILDGDNLEVYQVKCIEATQRGEVLEKEVINEETKSFEQKAMIHINDSIASLTKKKGDWEVISYLWPNKDYVYVEFSAIGSDEEVLIGEVLESDEVDSFLLLLKITKVESDINTEEIGLLKLDEDDEWIAERGEDLFDDVDEGRLFDFDSDLGKWVKIN